MLAYPQRFLAQRGDELLGLLLDLAEPGADRLPLRLVIDILSGGLRFRFRDRPPLVRWLLYRFVDVRLPGRWRAWARDDILGRHYPLRRQLAFALSGPVAFGLVTWPTGCPTGAPPSASARGTGRRSSRPRPRPADAGGRRPGVYRSGGARAAGRRPVRWGHRSDQHPGAPVARVVVDVMLKPEILDPQGQAVHGALPRLGFEGVSTVRQGKRFELELDGPADEAALARVREMAETLLANTVIEDFTVRVDDSSDGRDAGR